MQSLENLLRMHQQLFMPVVAFDAVKDKLLLMDFTAANAALTDDVLNDTFRFTQYIEKQLKENDAVYGIGGYDEHRTIYSRSAVFDAAHEPRRCHLGMDIWGKAGTIVYAPLGGVVHSFAFNDAYGDYGATIILQHQLAGFVFYSLYGHLSLSSLSSLQAGKYIAAGEPFASFGLPQENGHWPPHLHFQLIQDMQGKKGDYAGVCRYSERAVFLANCPNPDIILQMMQFAKVGYISR